MNSRKKALIAVISLIITIGGAYLLYDRLSGQNAPGSLASDDRGNGSQAAGEEQRTKAPDFTVYDKNSKPVSLSDYGGKPVVLNFWASWCGPCQMEMPGFDNAYMEMGNDVHFLMVNLTDGSRETVERAGNYIKDNGFSLPVFYDLDSDAAMTYEAFSVPMTFFIDKDGYLVAHAKGAIDEATLRRGIQMIQ